MHLQSHPTPISRKTKYGSNAESSETHETIKKKPWQPKKNIMNIHYWGNQKAAAKNQIVNKWLAPEENTQTLHLQTE